ncbi:hypothetical protein EST38_g7125 [Candolleomyces aberdarensis]|uniref:Late embryogenesis abundant protein LEA-2 subgroup domain-containing protein n=1 Tax=Candolleomyces aberdarensis TaxID=2316362 RepID=A0A4Q2DFX5_9AGAR|nr:hypothetical protein EST38_g7125 [Candolleomyces aberdarensis]
MASYNDPYSNSRYQDTTGYNAPYYSNQPYDTGPTYDPYSQSVPYNHPNNVRFDDSQDDVRKDETAPTPPSKDEYDNTGTGPTRYRSTKSTSSGLSKKSSLKVAVTPVRKHWNGFEHGEFTPTVSRGNLWTKGGRGRCIGRFFCCTLMIAILVIVSIILSLALWVRPPAVAIGDVVTQNTTGSLSSADGLAINLSVNITVNNPNYFSVDFSRIKAEIFYPINDLPMGGGEANDINFKSGTETSFTFPFSLRYRSSDDPGNQVFIDLGTKCGLGGGQKSDITVKYRITLGIRFLLVVISPVIENSFRFACPSSITGGGLISGSTGS